jgi:hypothetical protein
MSSEQREILKKSLYFVITLEFLSIRKGGSFCCLFDACWQDAKTLVHEAENIIVMANAMGDELWA